ncbi:MAG TPA: hypothetical protein VMT63_11700 [Bacteroidales bacterium]|nr:hypothetical protein [Bacteroidales bacterium]
MNASSLSKNNDLFKNKKVFNKKIKKLVNGKWIFITITILIPVSISSSNPILQKPIIEFTYRKSDKENENEQHKDEAFVVDLNQKPERIVYSQKAIGEDLLSIGLDDYI